MTKWMLAAGAAALALAGPALAERGGGHGGDKGKGGGAAVAKQHGGGERGGGKPMKIGGGERGGGKAAERRIDRSSGFAVRDQRKAEKADRPGRELRAADKRDRDDSKSLRALDKRDRDELRAIRSDEQRLARDVARERDFDRSFDWDDENLRGWRRFAALADDGIFDDCPPGLLAKNNGCLPPGQAMKLGYGVRAPDYLLRSRYMPLAQRDWWDEFYQDTPDDYYRYDNGYLYRIDRDDGLIEGIIPLLGGGYGVGQMLPAGYSIYNVPYQYRELYPYDDPNYLYHYGDGAIYQVNRSNNVIESVAALLANDLMVGSPLPMGYDAYNLPYQYRSQYYDTPDAWYRYNDGYIYQVDPTTRLITAVISAIV